METPDYIPDCILHEQAPHNVERSRRWREHAREVVQMGKRDFRISHEPATDEGWCVYERTRANVARMDAALARRATQRDAPITLGDAFGQGILIGLGIWLFWGVLLLITSLR